MSSITSIRASCSKSHLLRGPAAVWRLETLEARRLLSNGLDFSGGFAASTGLLAFNGNVGLEAAGPTPANSTIDLTTTHPSAGSVWYSTKQDVTRFVTRFRERTDAFDVDYGFTFTIQNSGDGLSTVGSPGGYLGYASASSPAKMQNSVAIKFDAFNNAGEGNNSTGLFIDGDKPTLPVPTSPFFAQEATVNLGSNDYAVSGIDLHNTNVKDVTLAYDGVTLRETIADTVTGVTFTHSYVIDIPAIVGGSTAYVGFTGGDSELAANQNILSWSYAGPDAPQTPQPPSALAAAWVDAGKVDLTWTANANPSGNQGYVVYRKGGEDDNFYPIASLAANVTSYSDTSVPAVYVPTRRNWEYRVAAHNVSGFSDFTDALAANLRGQPPANVAAITAGNAARISWTPVQQAQSYNLYRSTTAAGGGLTMPYRTGLTGTSFVDPSVISGTRYFYTLTAVGPDGESPPSAPTSTRLGGGLFGSYFPGPYYPGPLPSDDQALFTRVDMAGPSSGGLYLNAVPGYFDTGSLSPRNVYVAGAFNSSNTGVAAIDALGQFQVRWEGTFTPLTSETYTFGSLLQGHRLGVWAWVNGTPVVTAYKVEGVYEQTQVPIHLEAGTAYSIQIDSSLNVYPGSPGAPEEPPARFALGFETPTIPMQDVPLSQLSQTVLPPAAPTNLRATDVSFTAATLTWDVVPNAATYTVEASTDNLNFSAVAVTSGPTNTTVQVPLSAATTYYLRVVAANAAGRAASAPITVATLAVVGGQPDPGGGGGPATIVHGSDRNDHIVVLPVGDSGAYQVNVNGTTYGPFHDGRIVINGGGGDDDIQIAGTIATPSLVFGDGGNDRVYGGGGPNVLLGGDGNDELLGGSNRDLLIGGQGADHLVGNAADDILIAASTAYDDDDQSLCDIMAEWMRADAAFAVRVDDLSGAFNTFTVQDDNSVDQIDVLVGSSGDDWYIYKAGEDRASGVSRIEAEEAITNL
jgi:Ca2+-binding RTX toxin-like protein